MLPYVAIASLPVLASLTGRRYPSLISMLFIALVFILFMGFRDRVGPDWNTYWILHELSRYKEWDEIFSETEPFSFALFAIDSYLEMDMRLSNTVASLILIAGVVAFARQTPLPWIAFLCAMPYLVLVFGMSGIRQAMGVGVTLFVLSRWTRWGIFRKLFGVFVATMFHTSAILIAVFVVAGVRMRLSYRLLCAIPLTAIVVFVAGSTDQITDQISVYGDRYLAEGQVISHGSLFHIALVLLPGLVAFAYRRRLMHMVPFPDLMFMGILACIATLALNFVSSTGASRVTVYLYFVPMMFYPAFCLMQRRQDFPTIYYGLNVAQAFLLIAWLMTANTAFPYLPYRSTFF